MIKIYDTMSRDCENLSRLRTASQDVCCGPTVYNYIRRRGMARSTVAFDTIRRYFEYRGYGVAYIPILRMWMIRLSTVPRKKVSRLRRLRISTSLPFGRM